MGEILNLFYKPFGWLLSSLFMLVGNYGVALLLFTVIIKVLLFPLNIKQQKTTAMQMKFKPKLDALQKKYSKDRKKLYEEQQKLYEKEGFNPVGGCGPQLIQLVFLLIIYQVVTKPLTFVLNLAPSAISKAAEIAAKNIPNGGAVFRELNIIKDFAVNPQSYDFLGVTAQQMDFSFLGINLAQTPSLALNLLIIIPILSGLTAYLSSFIMAQFTKKNMGQTEGGGMNALTYFMPLISLFFTFKVPAGVGIYWIYTNIISIGQSFVLNKFFNPRKYLEQYQEEERRRAEIREENRRRLAEAREKEENEETEES